MTDGVDRKRAFIRWRLQDLMKLRLKDTSKSHFYRLHRPLRPENIALQDSSCICFKTRWAPLHIWTLRTLTDIKPFNMFSYMVCLEDKVQLQLITYNSHGFYLTCLRFPFIPLKKSIFLTWWNWEWWANFQNQAIYWSKEKFL